LQIAPENEVFITAATCEKDYWDGDPFLKLGDIFYNGDKHIEANIAYTCRDYSGNVMVGLNLAIMGITIFE